VNRFNRREFLTLAAAIGATASCANLKPKASRVSWQERRDLYPEGVASGDPDAQSVLLWTRRPFQNVTHGSLWLEVSEDQTFSRVVATTKITVLADSDWTCRVLVGNLNPDTLYWYRFTDDAGLGSRIGRTRTAPSDEDTRPVTFAFVSCQNVNLGAQNAYRRMIFEDERAPASEQLGFVLHLGDFIYEIVCYPEEHPQGIWDCRVRDTVRFANGEKIGKYNVPTTLEDYRALYRAYLHDPDLQDARARWPFVSIWDNHEFSQGGWQSIQVVGPVTRPAQALKVAANQAWFEYQPARIKKASGLSLDRFDPPKVVNTPINAFDEHGLGQEANNLAAISSLTGYRTLRWGRHVELIITDERSYRSERPASRPEAKALFSDQFPKCIPNEALAILDAGRTYAKGNAPSAIRLGSLEIPNFRKDQPPQTLLGAEQKSWFLERLRASSATWKVWGSSLGTLDRRVDLKNLPQGMTASWIHGDYATFEDGDFATAYAERAEIYSFIRNEKINGFVTVAGDRHSFWAGFAAPTLPPEAFEPVGIAFITASISMPSSAALLKDSVPPNHPLRSLYFKQAASGNVEPVINMLLRHGVLSCLEYAKSGNADLARKLTNPSLAPHLKFVDCESYGFSVIRASSDRLACEFVCVPKPTERAAEPNGGPILYRVEHKTRLAKAGEPLVLEQQILEGHPALSL
jgi:alkaline phosphatase D